MTIEAVRWARRIIHREMRLDYTKWHATEDYEFTLCKLPIPLALEGTYFPETTESISRVDCGNCLNQSAEWPVDAFDKRT